ncbi:MAG: serine/threonine-protein kinase [Planctomycetota bacterium]
MVHSERDLNEIEALFDRALPLVGIDRAVLLDGARAERPAVVREVESLLAAHESGSSILDRPPGLEGLDDVSTPARARGALVGEVLGGYRILAPIGVGGMGEVYEALQSSPERRVALKILLDRGRSQERFEVEARALARLDHPHVARVFGAGTNDGPDGTLSWMACEHIPAARTVTEFADERGLDVEARVRLFVQACRAMHHAHRKGVLHRDLKPANMLVSGDDAKEGRKEGQREGRRESRLKVIDFGLARLFDAVDAEDQLRTRRGELLGTLRYMSPEQCEGDPERLDVRTDVYALGLVLHELLTGRLPYDLEGRSLLQLLEAIRSQAPTDPSALVPEVDGDLGAIVLQSLRKDPEDRYDSAGDLADDLERWLRREPVAARRAGWIHRTRLFARRRAALFAGLVAGGLAGTVGLVVIVVLFLDNREQLRVIEETEREATEARGELAGVAELLGELVAEDALQVLERAALDQSAAETRAEQRDAVARAVAELRRLRGLLGDDVADARVLAEAFVDVGDLFGTEWAAGAADSRNGHEAYLEAARLWRRVSNAHPDDAEARRSLVAALTRLTHSCRRLRLHEQGSAYGDEAVSLARRGVEASERTPEDVEGLVEALFARGDVYIDFEPHVRGLVDSLEARDWVDVLRESGGHPLTVQRLESWVQLRLGHWLKREGDDPDGGFEAHRTSRILRTDLTRRSLARYAAGEPTEEKRYRFQNDLLQLFSAFGWNEVEAALDREDDAALVECLRALDDTYAVALQAVEERDDLPFATILDTLPYATVYVAALVDRIGDEEEQSLRLERIFWQWGEAAERGDVSIDELRDSFLYRWDELAPTGERSAEVREWVAERGWDW